MFELTRISNADALRHLDPRGEYADLDPNDAEGIAIRAACDMVWAMRDPPVRGKASERAALKDYLIGLGYWPAEPPRDPKRPDLED